MKSLNEMLVFRQVMSIIDQFKYRVFAWVTSNLPHGGTTEDFLEFDISIVQFILSNSLFAKIENVNADLIEREICHISGKL